MTIEEFGKTIKAKYPQYKDISDKDLGTKMLAKYPQYSDMVTAETPKKKSFLDKVGSFIGVEKLGKGIAGSIFWNTKTGKETLKLVEEGKLSPEQFQKDFGELLPSSKQIVGSAIQTAATIGTVGIGSAMAGTTGVLSRAVPAGIGIAKTAGLVGATGAVSGFGAGLEKEKTVPESLKQAFTTGLASAATYGVLAGAGKVIQKAMSKTPVKLMQVATKLDEKSANVLLENKDWGTLGKLKGVSDKRITELNDIIHSKITPESGTIEAKGFLKSIIAKIRGEYPGVSNAKLKTALLGADITPLIEGKTIDYSIADKIRQGIGSNLGSVWKTDNPKFNQYVRMSVWQELVNTIRPATNTAYEFEQLAAYTKASIKLNKVLASQSKRLGIGLTDLLTGLGVGLGGGGGVGGVAAAVTRKAITSPLAETFTAVQLNELNKFLTKIPTDSAGKISRDVLINAIKGTTNR